jgi:hypothetical protein
MISDGSWILLGTLFREYLLIPWHFQHGGDPSGPPLVLTAKAHCVGLCPIFFNPLGAIS